jgi:hypothetical protein
MKASKGIVKTVKFNWLFGFEIPTLVPMCVNKRDDGLDPRCKYLNLSLNYPLKHLKENGLSTTKHGDLHSQFEDHCMGKFILDKK